MIEGLRPYVLLAILLALAGLANADVVHPASPSKKRAIGTEPAWMRQGPATNLPELGTHRSRLVIAYCGQCHTPPPPRLFSDDEWRWLIVRMDLRLSAAEWPGLDIPSNDELKEIAKYYETYSPP